MGRVFRWIFVGSLLLVGSGCVETASQRSSYFDVAEEAYRRCDYDTAYKHYSAFLGQDPDPQLARLAERRMRSIKREISCVFGEKSGPRPVYVNRALPDESH